MPYEIVKSVAGGKKGYRLRNESTGEYFSKTAMPLDSVKKQRTAVIVSEIKSKKELENMKKGGMVKNKKKYKPVPGNQIDYGDTIPAVLEVGELVVSVENVPKVKRALKKANVKIPGL